MNVLDTLRSCDAYLDGHFELRSGLHSDRFFQCANVLRYPRIAGVLCTQLVALAQATSPLRVDTVIAPALGGIVVGHEVARVLDVPSIFAEKVDGALALRRFSIIKGDRYVVAEDVVTRGGRVQETIDLVEAGGGLVEAVLVLVDRSGGKLSIPYRLVSLFQMEPTTYEPATCPLCAKGLPLEHPGS
ncbi:MAG: orotate phosphoribosyltransferase [Verrucomicrobia bacterium]|nr:orotate phosphoribosyltransferase [Verrucomicrobiota bacterium]